jgi:hypothetical protein
LCQALSNLDQRLPAAQPSANNLSVPKTRRQRDQLILHYKVSVERYAELEHRCLQVAIEVGCDDGIEEPKSTCSGDERMRNRGCTKAKDAEKLGRNWLCHQVCSAKISYSSSNALFQPVFVM